MAFEVATALGGPLDVFAVRKLGVPGHEEMAMGAIASGGVIVLSDDVVRGLDIDPEIIQWVAEREGRELVRREQAYRGGRPMPDLEGRTVIVVDDGLATGASMRAAIRALRELTVVQIGIRNWTLTEANNRSTGARKSRRAGRAAATPRLAG